MERVNSGISTGYRPQPQNSYFSRLAYRKRERGLRLDGVLSESAAYNNARNQSTEREARREGLMIALKRLGTAVSVAAGLVYATATIHDVAIQRGDTHGEQYVGSADGPSLYTIIERNVEISGNCVQTKVRDSAQADPFNAGALEDGFVTGNEIVRIAFSCD